VLQSWAPVAAGTCDRRHVVPCLPGSALHRPDTACAHRLIPLAGHCRAILADIRERQLGTGQIAITHCMPTEWHMRALIGPHPRSAASMSWRTSGRMLPLTRPAQAPDSRCLRRAGVAAHASTRATRGTGVAGRPRRACSLPAVVTMVTRRPLHLRMHAPPGV
jgi:hypothetical protein